VRSERRWLPSAAVALVIVVVVLGGYVTAGALTGPEGPARTVGGAVTLRPPAGWEEVVDPDVPGTEARFSRGSATLDVFTGPAVGDARALAESYVRGSLDPSSSRLTVSSPTGWQAVPLDGGLTGVRLGYIGVFDQSGVPIEGEVTAVVTRTGAGVVFDGWAPQGQLRFGLDDVHTMIGRAVFA
jgi:hypothetical protein